MVFTALIFVLFMFVCVFVAVSESIRTSFEICLGFYRLTVMSIFVIELYSILGEGVIDMYHCVIENGGIYQSCHFFVLHEINEVQNWGVPKSDQEFNIL